VSKIKHCKPDILLPVLHTIIPNLKFAERKFQRFLPKSFSSNLDGGFMSLKNKKYFLLSHRKINLPLLFANLFFVFTITPNTTFAEDPCLTHRYTAQPVSEIVGNDFGAHDINNDGQLCVLSKDFRGVYTYDGNEIEELSPSGHCDLLNNTGGIAGYAVLDNSVKPALWIDGRTINIQEALTEPVIDWAHIYDMNDNNQVVGYYTVGVINGINSHTMAFMFSYDRTSGEYSARALGGFEGSTFSVARGINNLGQVVGKSKWQGHRDTAFIYENGVMQPIEGWDVQTEEMEYLQFANDINDNGQILGYRKEPSSPIAKPVIWENGIIHYLESPYNRGFPIKINNQGIAVGSVDHWHAAVWIDGRACDLNDSVLEDLGLELKGARAINDSGQILAYGSVVNPEGVYSRSYLLTPVGREFLRGDANGDGNIDISDVMTIASYVEDTTVELSPLDAGDVNDDGIVDDHDYIQLIRYLFMGGDAPAAPFPEMGYDLTSDNLN
jgi:probable HAF family extracellular repeat protein